MSRTGILFPLGIVFLAFGVHEFLRYGLTEHVALMLSFGTVNLLYTLYRFAVAKSASFERRRS